MEKFEKIEELRKELRDKIPAKVKDTTDRTNGITEMVFEEVTKFCRDNNIPLDNNKINKIIEENAEKNNETIEERISFIVDCVDEEVVRKEEEVKASGVIKETDKYELEQNSFSRSENVNSKTTVDDTQKIVDQLTSDLTKIKEHATSMAREAGYSEQDIAYIGSRIDSKIASLEENEGQEIYLMLRGGKEDLIKETVVEYENIEKELATEEKETKGNSFRDSLNVKDKEGLSLEEQNVFAKDTAEKVEEQQKNQQQSMREDVIL